MSADNYRYEVRIRTHVGAKAAHYAGPYRSLETAMAVAAAYKGKGETSIVYLATLSDAAFDAQELDRRDFESRQL